MNCWNILKRVRLKIDVIRVCFEDYMQETWALDDWKMNIYGLWINVYGYFIWTFEGNKIRWTCFGLLKIAIGLLGSVKEVKEDQRGKRDNKRILNQHNP